MALNVNDTASSADPAAAPPAVAGAESPPPPPPPTAAAVAPAAAPVAAALSGPALLAIAAVVGALSVVSLTLTLLGQQRVKTLEQELVRRQQDMQGQAIEARALAKQAQDSAQAAESKMSLLDARVAETAMQRSQLEELIGQLSRSRDENALADIDASLRVAMQQAAITGSAEPLVSALRQAEERVARMAQPRLERVRRALARDLDRARAVAVTDVTTLTIKLDEVIRLVDELPMLSQAELHSGAAAAAGSARAAAPARAASAAASASPPTALGQWLPWLGERWSRGSARVWQEVQALVRVSRIDNPEAILLAPEQAWFLRENLKLRLLNARLSLLSRQFDAAQSDLRDAQSALNRYFDRGNRRVLAAVDLLRQVGGQSRQLGLPRPDETLAALVAAQAGR